MAHKNSLNKVSVGKAEQIFYCCFTVGNINAFERREFKAFRQYFLNFVRKRKGGNAFCTITVQSGHNRFGTGDFLALFKKKVAEFFICHIINVHKITVNIITRKGAFVKAERMWNKYTNIVF